MTIGEGHNERATAAKHAVAQPVICTIIAGNYFAYARCLAESFLVQHPDGRVFVLLVDDLSKSLGSARELFTARSVAAIGFPDLLELAPRVPLCQQGRHDRARR